MGLREAECKCILGWDPLETVPEKSIFKPVAFWRDILVKVLQGNRTSRIYRDVSEEIY